VIKDELYFVAKLEGRKEGRKERKKERKKVLLFFSPYPGYVSTRQQIT
jgi:hypothetical protein